MAARRQNRNPDPCPEPWINGIRRYFESALAASEVVVWSADPESGLLLYISPNCEKLTGFSDREFLRAPDLWMSRVVPEDVTLRRAALNRLPAAGSMEVFYRFRRKDETVVWLGDRARRQEPTAGPNGRIDGLVMDVTQSVEERRELSSQLDRAKQAAIAAEETKAAFLASMSHEIRTPLNAVIGMGIVLQETDLNPLQREMVETICRSGETLLSLISHVIDFSQIETGRITCTPTLFSVDQVVAEVVSNMANSAHQKGLRLYYRVAREVPAQVEADEAHLRQVILNLLQNAITFTDQGEVEVLVGSALCGQLPALDFEVRDTGIGIEETQQPRLFQPFSKIVPDGPRRSGTGLGLVIAQRLVELLGGSMRLQSQPGVGTSVGFSIPVLEAPPRLAKPLWEGWRVALVEVDHRVARVLGRLLGLEGAVVRVYGPSEELHPRPEVVILHEPDSELLRKVCHALGKGEAPPPHLILVHGPFTRPPTAYAGHTLHALPWPILPHALNRVMNDRFRDGAGMRPKRYGGGTLFDPAMGTKLPLRILLAEDNPVNARVLTLLLERFGYSATVSTDGEEAVAAASEQPFDLILMDIQMPRLDGIEATRQIRANTAQAGGPQPRIIALTADAKVENFEIYRNAGMDDVVTKPVTVSSLHEALLGCRKEPQDPAPEADHREA